MGSSTRHPPAPRALDVAAIRPVVLVVDDDPDVREMLVEYLAFRGVRAICAANVDEADTVLAALRVDVIVTDYAMPGADGLSFLRAVRRSSPLRSMPVVMISAHDRLGDIAEAARAQGATFLSKPLDLPQLAATIETALGGRPSSRVPGRREGGVLVMGDTPPPSGGPEDQRPTQPAPDTPARGRVTFRLPRPPRLPDVREVLGDPMPGRDPRREPE